MNLRNKKQSLNVSIKCDSFPSARVGNTVSNLNFKKGLKSPLFRGQQYPISFYHQIRCCTKRANLVATSVQPTTLRYVLLNFKLFSNPNIIPAIFHKSASNSGRLVFGTLSYFRNNLLYISKLLRLRHLFQSLLQAFFAVVLKKKL